jgi:hypothetical protein
MISQDIHLIVKVEFHEENFRFTFFGKVNSASEFNENSFEKNKPLFSIDNQG